MSGFTLGGARKRKFGVHSKFLNKAAKKGGKKFKELVKRLINVQRAIRPHNPIAIPRFANNMRFGGLVNNERKFEDMLLSATALSATVFTQLIPDDGVNANKYWNAVAQGTGQNQRDGRQLKMLQLNLYISINYAGDANAAFADTSNRWVRLICYKDTQTNGAQCSVTDVLAQDHILGFNNLANAQRFVTLFDKRLMIAAANPVAILTGPVYHHFPQQRLLEEYLGLGGQVVNFGDTGLTAASIKDTSVQLMAIASHDDVTITIRGRFRFTD